MTNKIPPQGTAFCKLSDVEIALEVAKHRIIIELNLDGYTNGISSILKEELARVEKFEFMWIESSLPDEDGSSST